MRIAICGFLLALLWVEPATAQDGTAALQRMYAAYAGLKGYAYSLSATTVSRRGDEQVASGTRTIVRFSRPNRLHLETINPDAEVGSFRTASDGRQHVTYVAKYNTVQRQPAPPDMRGIMRNLQPFGVGVIVNIPLQCLRGPLPAGRVLRPVLGADTIVNGARCATVTATYRHPSLAGGALGRATFYISRRDNLLRKFVVRYRAVPTSYTDTVVENGAAVVKKVRSTYSLVMSEHVTAVQTNPGYGANDFALTVPRDAVEVAPAEPGSQVR